MMSCGKTDTPLGTSTASILGEEKLSQYKRADEAPVAGSQYNMMLSSIWSLVRAFSGCPSQSVQAKNFSMTQPHWPAGESTSPYPRDWGRVDCCFEYPLPHLS